MRWLVLLFAIAQIVTAWLPSGLGVGQSVAARSEPLTTPVTPAGYAFAIWGLIYAWSLAFAVWQALPGRRRDGLLEEARGPAALLFAADAAWSLYVQLSAIDAVSLAIIVAGLAGGLSAMARLRRFRPPLLSRPSLLARAPLALAAGWVSVAAFANLAAVMALLHLVPDQLGETGLAAILVAAAGLLAAWVTRAARASPAYPAAALWGIAAIAAANWGLPYREPVLVAAAAAACLVLLAAALRPRPR